MRNLIIFFNTGEILRATTKGTNPQILRDYPLGKVIYKREIKALTIEN